MEQSYCTSGFFRQRVTTRNHSNYQPTPKRRSIIAYSKRENARRDKCVAACVICFIFLAVAFYAFQTFPRKGTAIFPVFVFVSHPPGGLLVFEVGYHPRKKIHVIRVVFQDQTMYARTSFRGAKTCKIGKKGMFFGHMTNFGKDMTDKLKKSTCKNAYLGSIFIPEKYVFRVCFESPFTRMISNLKYKWPPPANPPSF